MCENVLVSLEDSDCVELCSRSSLVSGFCHSCPLVSFLRSVSPSDKESPDKKVAVTAYSQDILKPKKHTALKDVYSRVGALGVESGLLCLP